MARKGKFEDEKNILENIRKRLDEAILEAEDTQHSAAGNDDYKLALLHQGWAGKLREIKGACNVEKGDKKEIAELKSKGEKNE